MELMDMLVLVGFGFWFGSITTLLLIKGKSIRKEMK